MLLRKSDKLYLTVNCELGTITHKLLWQMFSSSSHSEQLSSAAAGLGTEFLWLLSRKLYSGLITVITVLIPPIIAPRGHTHYDLYSYHQGAATTAGAQFLLKLACVPLASGLQCPRHRENSVAGHDEAELITSQGDTVILSTLLDIVASASTRRITWPNNVRTRYY